METLTMKPGCRIPAPHIVDGGVLMAAVYIYPHFNNQPATKKWPFYRSLKPHRAFCNKVMAS